MAKKRKVKTVGFQVLSHRHSPLEFKTGRLWHARSASVFLTRAVAEMAIRRHIKNYAQDHSDSMGYVPERRSDFHVKRLVEAEEVGR